MVPGKAREKQAALKLSPSFWLFENQPHSYLENPKFSLYEFLQQLIKAIIWVERN